MPGLAYVVIIGSLVVTAFATAAWCIAIERHNKSSKRREAFGLAPLEFR